MKLVTLAVAALFAPSFALVTQSTSYAASSGVSYRRLAPAIPKGCPPRTAVVADIQMTFPQGTDPHNPARDIRNLAEVPPRPFPKANFPHAGSHELDFDLSEYLTPDNAGGRIKAARISLVIKDKDLEFAQDGSEVGNPNSDGMFCGLSHDPSDKGKRLQFFAIYLEKQPPHYVGQFEFRFAGGKLHGQTVYVDPHVGNNGLALTSPKAPRLPGHR